MFCFAKMVGLLTFIAVWCLVFLPEFLDLSEWFVSICSYLYPYRCRSSEIGVWWCLFSMYFGHFGKFSGVEQSSFSCGGFHKSPSQRIQTFLFFSKSLWVFLILFGESSELYQAKSKHQSLKKTMRNHPNQPPTHQNRRTHRDPRKT